LAGLVPAIHAFELPLASRRCRILSVSPSSCGSFAAAMAGATPGDDGDWGFADLSRYCRNRRPPYARIVGTAATRRRSLDGENSD
jgi:hypothetical protein